MSIFADYSKYYDLLYRDKNYQEEVSYVDGLIKKYSSKKVETLLDIGCGTGTHAGYFAELDYKISGIDISPEMIEIAKKKNIPNSNFSVGDGIKFNLEKKFDTVLTLFHVIDYYLSNKDLENALKSAKAHLKAGGLFIFDVWYGPCVLSDLPKLRAKEFNDEESQIIRLAIPDLYPNENRVDVNYEITILDKKTRAHNTVKETHKVRFFFKPEIENLLERNGFELLTSEEWLTGNKPGIDTFSVCFVGRLLK